MSYDVGIGSESFNFTSNVSKLFYDHIPDTGKGGGLHEIRGLTGKQAVAVLHEAFDRIERRRIELWQTNDVGEPHFCARYDVANGWGSAVGGLIFLAQILAACASNPRKRVHVGC